MSYHKCVICLATIYSLHMDQKGKIDHQMLIMHVSQSCVAPAAVKKGRLARFVAVVPSQHVVRGLRVFDANYVFFGLGEPTGTRSAVFLNIVQKGGGIKPMFKKYVANFV